MANKLGVKMNWHPECLIIVDVWGVQIPISPKGHSYITTIQRGSIQDLIPGIREQHVTCLQRIYQLGSHILATFRENLHMAFVYRKAGHGEHESFRYWRIMLFAASRFSKQQLIFLMTVSPAWQVCLIAKSCY